MEFNPLTIINPAVHKQLSIANNIFKETTSTYFNFSESIEKVP